MKIRRFAATSALLIAALGVTAGTAQALPATQAAPHGSAATTDQQRTGWTVQRNGNDVVVNTDAGTLGKENGYFVARDASGGLIAAVPLGYEANGTVIPVAAHITGNTATLTPDVHRAVPAAKYQGGQLHAADLQAATSGISSNVTLTAAIGGYIGGLIGATVGCIGGAIAGTAIGGTAVPIFGSAGGPVVGCIGGGVFLVNAATAAGAAIGGLIGAGANAPTFLTLLNQPPKSQAATTATQPAKPAPAKTADQHKQPVKPAK